MLTSKKGPAICMHRILLTADAKPLRQVQSRLNPLIVLLLGNNLFQESLFRIHRLK
uniref:Uncharacterized protein n=1 Tax=Utricularia reniformis TaxID=192314 RepID=A0A1Y0AZX6_9LAMI|nr:hypothetical protein AEK19_MT0415 [Utricularia reniformis]ART30681.1 hypothetical protein AEK19_MT0415 [Utricularia reniformis]